MRSALKNRVHAVLATHGLQRPYQRLFGPNGRAFLERLELRPPPRKRLDSLLRLIDDFDREIELARREIDALAEHDPRVDVLTQLKGVGPYTAMLVIAEAGEVERFASAAHFCSYAGLTPTVRSSAERARLGHISRQGSPHVRWAMVEAAHKAIIGPSALRSSFDRIARRRGRKIATVAVARKLLTLCYYGLRDGEIRCLQASGPGERDRCPDTDRGQASSVAASLR
jgi:transposase